MEKIQIILITIVCMIFLSITVISADVLIDYYCLDFNNSEKFCFQGNRILEEVTFENNTIINNNIILNTSKITVNGFLISQNTTQTTFITSASNKSWILKNTSGVYICGGC